MLYDSPLSQAITGLTLIWVGLVWWWFTKGRHLEPGSRIQQRFIAGVTVLFFLAVGAGTNPSMRVSDDEYRYEWDGWLLSNGVDPYSVVPNDSSVAHLQTQAGERTLPDELPYNQMKTIYPPGAQIIFAAIAVVAGTDTFWWHIIWLLLMGVLFGVIARSFEHDVNARTTLLLVLCSPLFIVHAYGDIHLDILVAGVMACAFIAVRHNLFLVAGLLLGEGIALKYTPIIALMFLLGNRSWNERWQLIGGAVLIVAITYVPFLGSDVAGNTSTFATLWKSNAGVFLFIREVTDPLASRMISGAVGLVLVAFVWMRYRQHVAFATGLTIVCFLLMSPVVHAWYLIPAALLTPLAPVRSVIVWTATSCVYLVFADGYANSGTWDEPPLLLIAEYLPVWVAFGIDMWKGPIKGLSPTLPSPVPSS